MQERLIMKRIILASKSPRRQQLLKEIIDNFDIIVSNSEEKKPLFVSLKNVPVHLAKQKAKEVYKNNKDALVIGADTVVICDNQILGKPKDKNDANRMITMLSNKTHIVVTGVYLIGKGIKKSFKCITEVTFKKMTEEEINNYCELSTIYDKAGAYAIQEDAGQYISRINGSYNNVVGLPIEELKKYLI